jgi:RNA-binding protein 8A
MSLTLAIQRRTGNVLGYSLIEFETKDEAQKAINNINGKEFMENILSVDFAFIAPPKISKSSRHSSRSGGKRRRN